MWDMHFFNYFFPNINHKRKSHLRLLNIATPTAPTRNKAQKCNLHRASAKETCEHAVVVVIYWEASSCIFLIFSLYLFPSLSGFFPIFLHVFTIGDAILGCASVSFDTRVKLYETCMVDTVLTAIFRNEYLMDLLLKLQ